MKKRRLHPSSILPTLPSRLPANKKTPDNAQAHSVPAINRPTRRAHSPSSRHRKALPVPVIPRSISQNAKSAEQETNSGVPPSPVIPSGARITHTQTRAGQGAISQRPRHKPPCPARSFVPRAPSSKTDARSSPSLLPRAAYPILSRRAKRAPNRNRTQASRPHPSPHPAHKSRTRAPDKARSHSVSRHKPPRPARSFSYCAIIALPCGAFRASSAARR